MVDDGQYDLELGVLRAVKGREGVVILDIGFKLSGFIGFVHLGVLDTLVGDRPFRSCKKRFWSLHLFFATEIARALEEGIGFVGIEDLRWICFRFVELYFIQET
jgi:hypothetical protein